MSRFQNIKYGKLHFQYKRVDCIAHSLDGMHRSESFPKRYDRLEHLVNKTIFLMSKRLIQRIILSVGGQGTLCLPYYTGTMQFAS